MISRLHAFRLLAASGLLAITPFALVVSGRSSQAQDPKPAADLRFEVASVKLNPPTIAEYLRSKGGDRSALLQSMGIQTMPGGRVLAMFATLRSLVLQAFDIKEYQLEGGPDWINTSRFEIDARANRAATPQELNTMLKALLVERFALRTRTEVRQVRQFELKVARDDGKLGPSLKPTAAACLAEIEERRRNPGPRPPRPSANSPEEGRAQMRTPECGVESMVFTGPFRTFTMSGMPLSTLVVRIDSELGAPVIDKTGLTGPLDAALEFESSRPTQVTPEVAPLLEFFQAVPLAFALQRQLGLKLEEVKAPLEIVVIEAAQRPTPD